MRCCVPLICASCLTPAWPDAGISPRGSAPWGFPTDVACDRRDDESTLEVDGFTFCGLEDGLAKVPVDDPIYYGCDEGDPNTTVELLAVFDGTRARGYAIAELIGRELVNTEWDGAPLLVDY